MVEPSTYALAQPVTREKRTAAAILGWVIDSLDGARRPRRNAEHVLRDVMSELEAGRHALAVVNGTLPQLGDTLAGRVVEALPAADSTLRSGSQKSTQLPEVPPGIQGLQHLETVTWQQINMLTMQGKTYGLANLIDQARKIKVDMLKFKEKETATMVPKAEVEEMMRRIKDALQPHPEALKAVMGALGG